MRSYVGVRLLLKLDQEGWSFIYFMGITPDNIFIQSRSTRSQLKPIYHHLLNPYQYHVWCASKLHVRQRSCSSCEQTKMQTQPCNNPPRACVLWDICSAPFSPKDQYFCFGFIFLLSFGSSASRDRLYRSGNIQRFKLNVPGYAF